MDVESWLECYGDQPPIFEEEMDWGIAPKLTVDYYELILCISDRVEREVTLFAFQLTGMYELES